MGYARGISSLDPREAGVHLHLRHAKNMSKAVEDRLMKMLAEAKGGSPEVEGAKELKLLKDRNVSVPAVADGLGSLLMS